MKFVSKTLVAFACAVIVSAPAMADTTVKGQSCPSVKVLALMSDKLNLAALDMMSVRSILKRTQQQPEAIGSTETYLKDVENAIDMMRANVSLCQVWNNLQATAQLSAQ